MKTMTEIAINQICAHEHRTGRPPTHLYMKEASFNQLVLEICISKKLNRQATRKAVRDTKTVKVLNVPIHREGSNRLPEVVRIVWEKHKSDADTKH